MKYLLIICAYTIIMTVITTGYAAHYDVSFEGHKIAVLGYKAIWTLYGFGLASIYDDIKTKQKDR